LSKEDNKMQENFVMEKQSFAKKLLKYLKSKITKEITIDFQDCVKTNDRVLQTITIQKSETGIGKNFYLEELYEQYKVGFSVEKIGDMVLEVGMAESEIEKKWDIPKMITEMHDYRQLLKEKKIFVRLMNREHNKIYLADKAWLPYLDLAIVFFYLVSSDDEGICSVGISGEVAEKWDISLEELLEKTLQIMTETMPAKVKVLKEVLDKLSDNSFTAMNPPEAPETADNFYLCTHSQGVNGASVLLYPDLLRNFAKEKGVEKLYIFPSSVHEILLCYDEEKPKMEQNMKNMIREVNVTAVVPEEVLSDNLYIYTLEDDKVSIWQGK
jgi:hypothetical protein